MKVKTSVTLSEDVLRDLDREVGAESRSAFIERLVRRHLRELDSARDFDRQVALLNAVADGPEPPQQFADPFAHGDDAALLLDDASGTR
jgi:metal-responsive CopG/Arc/MetJ family transcriptional regulator